MLTETDMLNNIRKGTQMGCYGINKILPKTGDSKLKNDLTSQRKEYEQIYDSANQMLEKRGGKKKDLSHAAMLSSGVMSDMKTLFNSSPTKIAEMMITGNTMGVTKSIRHLHGYNGGDERVLDIANKLLETEQQNITQMQQYL